MITYFSVFLYSESNGANEILLRLIVGKIFSLFYFGDVFDAKTSDFSVIISKITSVITTNEEI